MRVLLTSDWHLDWVTHGVQRIGDLGDAVDQTVRHAIDTRCGAYIFSGDLCDPDSGSRVFACIEVAIKAAMTLAAAGIPSLWLAGNHDVIEDGTGATTLSPLVGLDIDDIVVCDQPDVVALRDDLRIMALPFTASSHSYDPEDIAHKCGHPDIKLVVGHLSVPGIVPGEETTDMPRGREVVLPVDVLRIRCPRAKLINGHYHRQQVTDSGVIIPGSLARLTFNEQGNVPGFLVVDV